jgi:hypothetical protein
MAQQSKQQTAIAAAQTVASLMQQLRSIHDAVNAFMATNTNNSYDTTWVAFPTTVFASDGTVGTADGTPNNAHPISVPVATPLLVSRNDLLTAVGCLTNFQSFMTGVAVTTQANTPRKFADLLNS